MKFKINNRTWSIEEKSQSIIPRYYGVTHCDIQEIYLDRDLPIDRKRATLIHELTHCYIDNYITHDAKEYSEEDVADIVSNSYDIIHAIEDEYFKGNKD